MKMNAQQLREAVVQSSNPEIQKVERNNIYLLLENVYDTYNIGGLFRLADALAVKKMYLCGEMETPPNSRILKASIGTYKIVPWEYKQTAIEAIEELKKQEPGIKIAAVEQDKRSIEYQKARYIAPMALLVGNETFGVTPETLERVDEILEIPMWGVNKSLNVIVSAAIVSYWAMGQLQNG
jgi:tRNA G18 (ribose-2'-O)-methylase SpoU